MDGEKVLHNNCDTVKDRVAVAVHKSLVRIIGGGFVLRSNRTAPADNNDEIIHRSFSSTSNLSWIEQLRDIAYTTVSFPNGTNRADGDSVNGSPSDVDVRAALTLYNRIKKRHYELLSLSLVHDRSSSSSGATVERGTLHYDKEPRAKKRNVVSRTKDIVEFDIVSDLGTHRRVTGAKSLAHLLSVEVEQELCVEKTSFADCTVDSTGVFYDIRPSNSGILCLVSSTRSKQLHAAGRVPCAKCVKWCKGMKGLWWHMLKEHGVDYSNAMEVAACSVNELAVVNFREPNMCIHPTIGPSKELRNLSNKNSPRQVKHVSDDEADVFELVKNGKLDVLKLQDLSRLNNHLDKNGATLLHWGAGCGHVHIVSYLIETCDFCPNQGQIGKRSFSGRTPLHWAARNGHLKVVEYLIERCNINIEAKTLDGTTAFCWAAWQGHLDVMK